MHDRANDSHTPYQPVIANAASLELIPSFYVKLDSGIKQCSLIMVQCRVAHRAFAEVYA